MAGLTQTLVATVEPNEATDKTVTWESSNGDVASVKDGVVTALKEGTATITARAQDKSATLVMASLTTVAQIKVKPGHKVFVIFDDKTGDFDEKSEYIVEFLIQDARWQVAD